MVFLLRQLINFLSITTLWIILLVYHQINLVLSDDFGDDDLKKALEAIEHRQRDLELQENEYYGQPENIGYGFQKALGFFDGSGSFADLGNYDADPKVDNNFQNFAYNYPGDRSGEDGNQKSNFKGRISAGEYGYLEPDGNNKDEYFQGETEYLPTRKNFWATKYQSQMKGDDLSKNLEDLSDEELEGILKFFYERGEEGDDRRGTKYREYEAVPMRSRKNYRVFEGLRDKSMKRYPSFGEGIYGKKNYRSQFERYENPQENEFPYSVKYIGSPEREVTGNLKEMSYEDSSDGSREAETLGLFDRGRNRAKYEEVEEPYWSKVRNPYDDEIWLQGPVSFSDEWYDGPGGNEKRAGSSPKVFKVHNGIRLNAKSYPMKRSSIRVRKDVKDEKVSKESKGVSPSTSSAIIATTTFPAVTSVPPKKKGSEKKATGTVLKTKPSVTKHPEGKKVIRSVQNKKGASSERRNEEIVELFAGDKKPVSKKSIDWSQYFGIDKRTRYSSRDINDWLNQDSLSRSESHFLAPKRKRLSLGSEGDGLERSRYQEPFDMRRFDKKGYSSDVGSSIDKVETKIGDIEEKIIDDALKYTGAHSGVNGEDLNEVKSKVIQRLEAAYSLEKMRSALEEFKNLIRPQGRGGRVGGGRSDFSRKTATDAPNLSPLQTISSISKESANLEKPLEDKKSTREDFTGEKTRNEGIKNIFDHDDSDNLEFLNETPYARRQYENEECPILDQVLQNCMRAEKTGRKYADSLVPLCSLQQICYVCGPELGFSKLSMCDSMYMAEAQNVCQGNGECLLSARDGLLTLRDLYEQDFMYKSSRRVLSGTCLANPCIRRFFFNSPGAIYPLDVQM